MRKMFAALLLVPALVMADEASVKPEIKTGDPLPAFQINDQHDKPYAIPADTRLIVFTADKSAGDLLNAYLKQQPADFMPQRKMVYIADISAMPGLITSMVALPKMRDYAYRVAIGAEKEQTAMLPRAEDSVTLIYAEGGKITQIQQFKESEAGPLHAALNALAPVVQKP